MYKSVLENQNLKIQLLIDESSADKKESDQLKDTSLPSEVVCQLVKSKRIIQKRQEFLEVVVKDVLGEFKKANLQHCAYTTYDLGLVESVQAKLTNHIQTTYGVKL